jgi:hypothetical protein
MSTRTRNTTTTSGQSVVQNGKSQNNIKRNLLNRREAAGRLTFPVNAKRNNANKVNKVNNTNRNNVNTRNSVLLKNMNREYLQSCYLNTYTTLAYVAGQTKISDAVLARYMISFETLLSKLNGKLTSAKEKTLEELWNKTRNYENKNTFSNDANVERTLTYYKNIMENGFIQQGNSKIASLSRNLK